MIREEAIREAFEIVNALHWDKETLHLYSLRNIYVQDEANRVSFGYKKGLTEGEAKGLKKGLQKGELKNQQATLPKTARPAPDFSDLFECLPAIRRRSHYNNRSDSFCSPPATLQFNLKLDCFAVQSLR